MKFLSENFTVQIFFLVLTVSFLRVATAGELYKWVNEEGRVTYQGSPPPENATGVEKTEIKSPAPDILEEDKAEIAPILFYSSSDCKICDDARSYFQDLGVSFEEVSLTENEDKVKELDEKIGYSDAPILKIGEKYITGFNKKLVSNILKKEGYEVPEE